MRSLEWVQSLLADLPQRIGRFTVLSEPADPDLQAFFLEHVGGTLPDMKAADADAGRRLLLDAYEAAKREGYRFYSFGDAMLIV